MVTNKEADEYKNLEVTFIHGRKAILTIFDDGKETEKITLSDYNSREAMHQLLEEKGFEKKPEEEIRKMKEKLPAAPVVGGKPNKAVVANKPMPMDKAGVRGGAAAATDTASAAAVETATDGAPSEAVNIGKKDNIDGNDNGDKDNDDGEDIDDDEAEDDDDADGGETDDDDDETNEASTSTAQVRKVKVVKAATTGKNQSNTPRFVLAVSTMCVLFFVLSRRFPALRILLVPITRLVGFGSKHPHAR